MNLPLNDGGRCIQKCNNNNNNIGEFTWERRKGWQQNSNVSSQCSLAFWIWKSNKGNKMKHRGSKEESSLRNLTHGIIFIISLMCSEFESWLRHSVAYAGPIIIALENIFPLTPSLLKFHICSCRCCICVPTVILVSQQWDLNVPTSVSQW